jgi:glycosyltransferase involved in cell wall biosynthesis
VKVAHAVVITPHRCGLYETTRELVAGLRKLGVDSRMIDPAPKNVKKPDNEDRGALYASMGWAVDADVIVNHSGYDGTPLSMTKQPVIHVAHGRPRNSFISEVKGHTPIYSYWYAKNKEPRFAAIVTFWPEHKPYLDVMFPGKKVHVVQASCDLEQWKLDGPSGYKFSGKKGRVNIVISDHAADDIDQFMPLNAAILFAREVEGVKVHFYAHPREVDKKTEKVIVAKGYSALVARLRDDGALGELKGWVEGLGNAYRAATMILTGNEIDTRTVREGMACGCPVVRVTHLNEGWQVPLRKAMLASKEDRYLIRKQAEGKFNPSVSAAQFKKILEETHGNIIRS